jgi:hypothetical protein
MDNSNIPQLGYQAAAEDRAKAHFPMPVLCGATTCVWFESLPAYLS